MTIIYCIPSIYNSGGMERILSVKTNYLSDKLGWNIYIVTTDQNNRRPFFNFSTKIKIIDLGINYSTIKRLPLINRILKRITIGKTHLEKLQNVIDEIKPDVIVSMFQQDSLIVPKLHFNGQRLLEAHFSKDVMEFRKESGLLKKIIAKFNTLRYERLVPKYDKFITLTQEDASSWKSSNIQVIPNPVTIKNENREVNKNKKFISVGRLCNQKGFDLLMRSWALICKKYPDWTLQIVGSQEDNQYFHYLLKIKEELRIPAESISFQDTVSDITAEYRSSEFLVMASRYEGLPLALIEAQSCGLPCISFDCKCGPKEVINNGQNGFLIKSNDIEGMSQKIEILINNNELRYQMGQRAQIDSGRFSLESVMKKWIELFELTTEDD